MCLRATGWGSSDVSALPVSYTIYPLHCRYLRMKYQSHNGWLPPGKFSISHALLPRVEAFFFLLQLNNLLTKFERTQLMWIHLDRTLQFVIWD